MPARTAPGSVDDYLAAQPAPARAVLRRVRAAIRAALPDAVEGISYQIPVYKVNGRMVLYFAGFQHHYSVYPASAQLLDTLGDAIAGRLHSRATIRFSYGEAVPARLIARIAKLRAVEAAGRTPASTAVKKGAARSTPARRASGVRRTARR